MANIKSSYEEVRIPFAKMSFTPDVPSTALGPNEYNSGKNIESDVRGIRAVAGDEEILKSVPGTPTFVTGGFRLQGQFWFIVATTEGYWYASDGITDWYNITPGGGPINGYAQNTNITEAWNGTVPFFNDTIGAPMFWPDTDGAIMTQYSNLLQPDGITDITYVNPTTMRITLETGYATAPYISGQQIVISSVNNYFNGKFTVVSSTTTTIDYLAIPGASYPAGTVGQVAPAYTWNYNPNWYTVKANFLRIYSTPNVGSILIAGDLTATDINSTTETGDTTNTSDVILLSTANNDMIGAAILGSGIPDNSTIISVDPGVSVTISEPATITATGVSLELHLATIYPVTVQWSQAFGLNQAPSTWEPTITNVANQLEVPLRGPCIDGFAFNGQFFLCSYWDTVVFSPINYSTTSAPILGVRLFNQGRGLLSSNTWANTDRTIYGVDARDIWVFDGTDFTGLGNQRTKNWFFDQLDPQYYDRVFMECNTQRNQIEIYYPDRDAIDGVPNKMLSYRYDLDIWNPPRDVSDATMGCEAPIYHYDSGSDTYIPNFGSRTIVYARGVLDAKIIQKDQGYSFITTEANPNGDIESVFRRDNIKLLKDYSGKLMVHRILPEVVNVGDNELPVDPATSSHKGNITVTIMGAESVASTPLSKVPVEMTIDTESPWCQIDQNAFRVNTIEISNTSNNALWMCSAATWQITQTEDDR